MHVVRTVLLVHLVYSVILNFTSMSLDCSRELAYTIVQVWVGVVRCGWVESAM